MGPYRSSKRETNFRRCLFTFSIKCEIRHYQVVVVQKRQSSAPKMERCTCKVVVLLIKPIVSRCRPVVGSIDMVDVNCQNWPIIGDSKTAYHLDGKPGNFGENSNGLFIPEEIFREKSNTFRGITFFRFLPKRPKFSVPFVWITSGRL